MRSPLVLSEAGDTIWWSYELSHCSFRRPPTSRWHTRIQKMHPGGGSANRPLGTYCNSSSSAPTSTGTHEQQPPWHPYKRGGPNTAGHHIVSCQPTHSNHLWQPECSSHTDSQSPRNDLLHSTLRLSTLVQTILLGVDARSALRSHHGGVKDQRTNDFNHGPLLRIPTDGTAWWVSPRVVPRSWF